MEKDKSSEYSDNVFEMGILYQMIRALRKVLESSGKNRSLIAKDVDKIIVKIKSLLHDEVDKL